MIGTIKKELLDQREKLLRYCHDETCDDIYTCPWEHEKCEKKLDLDTAIAWITGYIVFQIFYRASLDDLKDYLRILSYLYEIVRLHQDRYPMLSQLLYDTYRLADNLFCAEMMEWQRERQRINDNSDR